MSISRILRVISSAAAAASVVLLSAGSSVAGNLELNNTTGVNYGEGIGQKGVFTAYVCNNVYFEEEDNLVTFTTDETDFVHGLTLYGNTGPNVLTCDTISTKWSYVTVFFEINGREYEVELDKYSNTLHLDNDGFYTF